MRTESRNAEGGPAFVEAIVTLALISSWVAATGAIRTKVGVCGVTPFPAVVLTRHCTSDSASSKGGLRGEPSGNIPVSRLGVPVV